MKAHMPGSASLMEKDVLAAARGDRDAYVRLIDGHRTLVCSIALAIVRDLPTSEDVAQEVFLTAWQGLGQLRNPTSFGPWIRQLTRNHARDVLRTRRRHGPRLTEEQKEGLLAAFVDPQPLAAERLIEEEERRLLAQALEQLPDEAREVVNLYYREGQSVEQVARLLGLREDAVKKRLSRARTRLREALLDRIGGALERSAPTAAFTVAVVRVIGALAVTAPTTATAASIGVGLPGQLGLGGKIATSLGAAMSGALLGAIGVIVPWRSLYQAARDDEERRGLVRFLMIMVLAVCLGALAMPLGYVLGGRAGLVAAFAAYAGAIELGHWVWLPRIIARRLAEDPAAARDERRRRRWQFVVHAIGLLISSATIWYLCTRAP
jgi:RNA polymerase sigma factor (sigma-70 family)